MRRDKKIAFGLGAIFLLVCFFLISSLSDKALGYDTSIAHPNIARLAAELYNQQPGVGKLSNQDIDWIAKGAEEEDTPFRWYNHFYDPIYNRGIWFGKQYSTAKDWGETSVLQNDYALGDQSWNRALYDYYKNDRESAMLALGHTLHLLADMTVPAHTRDDIHPSGDSYEQFVKVNWDNIYPQFKDKVKFREVANIDSAFDVLAGFSNGYFYSDDTIEDKKYIIQNIADYKIQKQSQGNPLYFVVGDLGYYLYVTSGVNDWKKVDQFKDVNHPLVLTSYSTQLIPKAIGYSAGAIKLFFSEAAKGNKGEGVTFLQTTPLGYVNTLLGAVGNGVQSLLSSAKSNAVAPARSEAPANLSTGNILAETSQNIAPEPVVVKQKEPVPVVPTPIVVPKAPILGPTENIPDEPVVVVQPIAVPTPEPSPVIVNPFPVYYGGGGGSSSNPTPPDTTPTSTIEIATTTIETPTTTTETSTTTVEVPTTTIETSTTTPETPTTTIETPTTTIEVPTTTIEIPTSTPTTTPETPTTTPATTTPEIPTYPVYSQEVVINEVAWAGTSADYPTNEWIELYNPTDQEISLFNLTPTSWRLKVGDYEISFNKIFNGSIPAHGYYLLERTRDETVREVSADATYNLAYGLNNDGAKMQLIKPDGTISDEVDCSEHGWFAGDTIKYRTMERLSATASGSDPANWQSNRGPRITPRTYNGGQVYGSPKSANTGGMIALNTYQEDAEVILTKDDNPYILGCYNIPAGKKLTIEAGVIIKSYINSGCFDVYGTLQVNGTPAEPVVFTSGRDLMADPNFIGQYAAGEPAANDWRGIWFRTGAIGNLNNLDMRYAGKDFYPNGYIYTVAVSEAIRSEGANLNIQNSKFLHNGAKFIHALSATNLTVENSVFIDGGLAIQGDGGTATLNNNEFLSFTEDPPVQVLILP